MTAPMVLHLSNTPCAGAVGMLSNAIEKYSYYSSKVFVKRTAVSAGNFSMDYKNNIGLNELQSCINQASIIHLHNCEPKDFKMSGKKFLVQLHSEPSIKGRIAHKYPKNSCTIAQKHATLYRLPYVPNIIPIYDELYLPDTHRNKNLVRIVYAPTTLTDPPTYKGTCKGKGYQKTMDVLKFLKQKFGKNLEYYVFFRVSKEEVMQMKKTSDIVIDECVTGGYHLCGLEGLATGNVVVGNINKVVAEILCKVTGSTVDELPWINTDIDELTKTLTKLITMKLTKNDRFEAKRRKGVAWINKYYRPENLVVKYEDLYNKILNVKSNPWSNLRVSSNIDLIRQKRKNMHNYYYKHHNKQEIKIKKLLNCEKGKSALVTGSGPSINKINIFRFLKKRKPDMLNCNYYYLQSDKFIPKYWFNIDSNCVTECLKKVPKETPIILNPPMTETELKHNYCWIDKSKVFMDNYFDFKFEYERPCTVATIMTLFALFMGYNPIYIIGVDLSLNSTKNNYAYSSKTGTAYNKKFRDFKVNYLHIVKEFKLIKQQAEKMGVDIYNLDSNPENFNVFEVLKWM